jgi:cobalt-zinc-cadmium efflux system outer membrane protein
MLAIASISACTSTNPGPAFRDVAADVQARTGHTIRWRSAGAEDEAVRAAIRDLLAKDLTLDAALEIALLNNPTLQATYEELGVAQADLVQAGLLKNPIFTAAGGVPVGTSDGVSSFSFGIVQDFLSLFTIGARRSVATAQLEASKARVGSAVLATVRDVRVAYVMLQGAMQACAMQRLVADAAEASVELATRQKQADTISELSLASEQALYVSVVLGLRKSELEVARARENLNRLLGLFGAETDWRVTATLPTLPERDPSLEHVESLAVSQRLDLVAAHKDCEVVSYALALAKNTRWFGGIDAGVSYEKTAEGYRLIGGTLSFELPIFDQRQAAIARLASQLRAALARERALAIDVRADVREARVTLLASRGVVETYRKTLVPLRERIVALSQVEYNAMLLGVFMLIAAKQAESTAYRDLIDATRDYWIARADLEWKAGGKLAPESVAPSAK